MNKIISYTGDHKWRDKPGTNMLYVFGNLLLYALPITFSITLVPFLKFPPSLRTSSNASAYSLTASYRYAAYMGTYEQRNHTKYEARYLCKIAAEVSLSTPMIVTSRTCANSTIWLAKNSKFKSAWSPSVVKLSKCVCAQVVLNAICSQQVW